MNRRMMALSAILALSFTADAPAADTFVGRWAADPSACSGLGLGGNSLVATETHLRWADASCRIGKIYRIGAAVHIQARCFGGGADRDVPVMLAPRGERLTIAWNGRPVRELRRCR